MEPGDKALAADPSANKDILFKTLWLSPFLIMILVMIAYEAHAPAYILLSVLCFLGGMFYLIISKIGEDSSKIENITVRFI